MTQNKPLEPLLTEDHPPIIKWLVVIGLLLLLIVAILSYVQWRKTEVVPGGSGEQIEVSEADRQRMIALLNQPARPVTEADRAAILKLLEN